MTVIAGRRDTRQPDDAGAVTATRDYLVACDAAIARATTAAEVQQKVKAKYPALLLDIILERGAGAQYPSKK